MGTIGAVVSIGIVAGPALGVTSGLMATSGTLGQMVGVSIIKRELIFRNFNGVARNLILDRFYR